MKRVATPARAAFAFALAASLAAGTVGAAPLCGPPGKTQPFAASFEFQEKLQGACADGTARFEAIGMGSASGIGPTGFHSLNCVALQAVPVRFVGRDVKLTAENGDTITAAYTGTATPSATGDQFALSGVYQITGGTGRFRRAQGCGVLTGVETLVFGSVPGVPPGMPVGGAGRIELRGAIAY